MLLTPPRRTDGPARLVFILRSTSVRSHRGQVSFAGGRADPEDPSPQATALRELEEELGVPRERVHVVGILPKIPALDGTPVVPVLGVTDFCLEAMQPNAAEVQEVFVGAWTDLMRVNDRPFSFNIFGNWRDSHRFVLAETPPTRSIWGLTALILALADMR